MKLSNMATVLRDAGLTVVETAGWANRGYANQDLQAVAGVLWHHTATHRSRFPEDAPTLSMCINGRSDLAGPLCNIVFGRNGTVYLTAAGVANHAGAGSAPGIPVNMGNHYLIGIEMESSGIAPWDWTPDQLRVAPHLGAALERAYGVSLQLAHYEYSSQGKIDPAGWPGGMDGLRAQINAVLDGGITPQGTITSIPEDDVALTDAQVKQLEMIPMLRDMINNLAGGINDVPGKVLDKPLPVAGQEGVTTTLGLFLSYASADREAMLAGIREAVASIPAADLAEQINAAGIAVEIRDRLVDLIDGTPSNG